MSSCKCQRVVKAFWIFVLVSTLDTISHSVAEEKQEIPEKYRGLERKGTVKTIVDPEDDIVIDCVNFHQQPAFDDPLIKSLKVDPSYFPERVKITNEDLKKSGLYQNWRKYGECPTGTIPIRRIQNRNTHRKVRLPSKNDNPEDHEYAIVRYRAGPYGNFYGGGADLNLWNPRTELQEFSNTQIWVTSGILEKKTSIEAGWIVYPERYHDGRPINFIYWTVDGYEKTGCYDLDCPGFIQTCADYCLGIPQDPSLYNSVASQYDIGVELYRLQNGPYANWFLNLNGKQIGYWPGNVVNGLRNGAEAIGWGAEIINTKEEKHHTSTQMASGHFPEEGYSRASYVKKLRTMNADSKWIDLDPHNYLEFIITKPECYNMSKPTSNDELGTHFYYGGPGYSETCKN